MKHLFLIVCIGFGLWNLSLSSVSAASRTPESLSAQATESTPQAEKKARRLQDKMDKKLQKWSKPRKSAKRVLDKNLKNAITFGIVFLILIFSVTIGGPPVLGFIIGVFALLFFVLTLLQLVKWLRKSDSTSDETPSREGPTN